MKTPDTITAKVFKFRKKFVRDDGLMDKYHGDETTAQAIEAFLVEESLDVRRENQEREQELVEGLVSMYDQYCGEYGHSFMSSGEHASYLLTQYGYEFDRAGKLTKRPSRNLPNTPTL